MSGPGYLDHSAYRLLAQKHRPADARVAVAELAAQGLRAADIARLLGLSELAVTALLQRLPAASGEAARIHAEAWSRKS